MENTITSRLGEYKTRSHLRESSTEILDRAAKWFIELCGDMDPRGVTYGNIDDYKSWLAKGRSESSANTYMSVFSPFWSWMAKRHYIEQNPFDGVRLYKVQQKKFDTFKLDEIERLLSISTNLWKTIICLGLCGMREGEILNLVVSDIDFEKNMLRITPKKNTPYTWLWEIKDYSQAFVGFDDTVNKLLTIQCESLKGSMQPYPCLKPRYWERNLRLKKEGKLRHRLRNCPWGNFTRDFRTLMGRALVKPKRFHDLRGTFATERYKHGYNIKELQYLLRHSSIQTTARYIHSFEEQKLVAKSGLTFQNIYASKVTNKKAVG